MENYDFYRHFEYLNCLIYLTRFVPVCVYLRNPFNVSVKAIIVEIVRTFPVVDSIYLADLTVK